MRSPSRIRSTIAIITSPPEAVREAAVVHKVLTDPTRLPILERLSSEEGAVSDIMRHVDLSQPLVSWHLRRLRQAGLVQSQRAGREVVYSLSRDALQRFHEQERVMLGIENVAS